MGVAYGAGYGAERRRAGKRGFSFANAEAAAYVAAMAEPPDDARKAVIDALIGGLKADGLWSGIHLIGLHAAHHHQAARIDAKNPSRVAVPGGNAGNGPDFLVDNGFLGNETDTELDWGIGFDAIGIGQNNHSCLVWSLTDKNGSATTNADFGQKGGATLLMSIGCRLASNLNIRSANATSVAQAVANSLGLHGFDRHEAGTVQLVRNGAFVLSFNRTSAGLPAENVATLRAGTTRWGENRIAITLVANSLAEAQHLLLFNRLNAYLEAVLGTPVPF